MIICFSGTGNTLSVARRLARCLDDEVTVVDLRMLLDAPCADSYAGSRSRVVWMFPVYAWGLPGIMERLIETVSARAFGEATHWMVATCGDDVGLTPKLWRKAMAARGFHAAAAFSVTMPNTYVFLPGFNFDSPEVASGKRNRMEPRVDSIAARISGSELTGEIPADDVVPGAAPWMKTEVLRPLFNRFLTSPRGFRVDSGRCTRCSTCVRVCPLDNITMSGAGPVWADRCTFCTACFNRCPERAISWKL